MRHALARLSILLSLLALAAPAVHAQIKLGISGPLEGSNAGSMLELVQGAEMYLASVNEKGGVAGRRVVLVARNDDFKVEQTVKVARKLIEEDGVIALMLVRGTPHNEAILPLVAEHRVPLIGPSTGAMIFHQPVNPYVFNVRTPYQVEAQKLVKLLHLSGLRQIAVLHVADSFGADVLEGLKQGFASIVLKPTAVVAFDRNAALKDTTDFMQPALAVLTKPEHEVAHERRVVPEPDVPIHPEHAVLRDSGCEPLPENDVVGPPGDQRNG